MRHLLRRRRNFLVFSGVVLFGLGFVGSVYADHSMMDPSASCYSCHTRKFSAVLGFTNHIRTSLPKLATPADSRKRDHR